jgi:hypothetical protein
MDTNNRANEIIVEILQNSLVGQLDPSSNFRPQAVAEAIAAKIDFEKTNGQVKSDHLVGAITDSIVTLRTEMKEILEDNSKHAVPDILLSNFIRGKLTAYEEILAALKKF